MAESDLSVLILAGEMTLRGSSAQLLSLLEELPKQGIRTRLGCVRVDFLDARRRSGLNISQHPWLATPGIGLLSAQMMLRELRASPPDVLHIYSRRLLGVGKFLADRLQRPIVLTIHDYLQAGEVLRFSGRWCRRIIAVSESVRDELVQQTRISGAIVAVIHSGVRIGTQTALDAPPFSGKAVVIGTAGPLEAAKGLTYFLEAAQLVLQTHPHTGFVIAGAGPEEKSLRERARNMHITEQVTFVPRLLDFSDAIRAMDVYCLPSLKQGLGTIMLEAMAQGRPVIATGAGGVYSVVREGETGLLVPPADSVALAAKIRELLNDPERARQMGQAARQLVESEFRLEKMVELTARIYRETSGKTETPRSSMALVRNSSSSSISRDRI